MDASPRRRKDIQGAGGYGGISNEGTRLFFELSVEFDLIRYKSGWTLEL